MGASNELWLFTMNFPYGHGEAYLETELPLVAAGYERVVILPLEGHGAARPLPANVEVQLLMPGALMYKPLPLGKVLTILPRFLQLWKAVARTAPSPELLAARRRELFSILRQTFNRQQVLVQACGKRYDPDRVTLYSYWTSDWAGVLGCWRLADPRVQFVSRMHGFDLYAERATDKWPLLQGFHVQQAKRIFVASQAGLDDLLARYPERSSTFRLARLGTHDHGRGPWAATDVLRIVSCSNLVPLKRVHLIAEALRHVGRPVQWTHFGDGAERKAVEAVVNTLPPDIDVELMGSRPNHEVIAWYRTRPVDVFVHASSTEGGAPVALQEAASFGIPLIGIDAGGVREVVTGESGILLAPDAGAVEIGNALRAFPGSVWHQEKAREQVRNFWRSRFDANAVYTAFLRDLRT